MVVVEADVVHLEDEVEFLGEDPGGEAVVGVFDEEEEALDDFEATELAAGELGEKLVALAGDFEIDGHGGAASEDIALHDDAAAVF